MLLGTGLENGWSILARFMGFQLLLLNLHILLLTAQVVVRKLLKLLAPGLIDALIVGI